MSLRLFTKKIAQLFVMKEVDVAQEVLKLAESKPKETLLALASLMSSFQDVIGVTVAVLKQKGTLLWSQLGNTERTEFLREATRSPITAVITRQLASMKLPRNSWPNIADHLVREKALRHIGELVCVYKTDFLPYRDKIMCLVIEGLQPSSFDVTLAALGHLISELGQHFLPAEELHVVIDRIVDQTEAKPSCFEFFKLVAQKYKDDVPLAVLGRFVGPFLKLLQNGVFSDSALQLWEEMLQSMRFSMSKEKLEMFCKISEFNQLIKTIFTLLLRDRHANHLVNTVHFSCICDLAPWAVEILQDEPVGQTEGSIMVVSAVTPCQPSPLQHQLISRCFEEVVKELQSGAAVDAFKRSVQYQFIADVAFYQPESFLKMDGYRKALPIISEAVLNHATSRLVYRCACESVHCIALACNRLKIHDYDREFARILHALVGYLLVSNKQVTTITLALNSILLLLRQDDAMESAKQLSQLLNRDEASNVSRRDCQLATTLLKKFPMAVKVRPMKKWIEGILESYHENREDLILAGNMLAMKNEKGWTFNDFYRLPPYLKRSALAVLAFGLRDGDDNPMHPEAPWWRVPRELTLIILQQWVNAELEMAIHAAESNVPHPHLNDNVLRIMDDADVSAVAELAFEFHFQRTHGDLAPKRKMPSDNNNAGTSTPPPKRRRTRI